MHYRIKPPDGEPIKLAYKLIQMMAPMVWLRSLYWGAQVLGIWQTIDFGNKSELKCSRHTRRGQGKRDA